MTNIAEYWTVAVYVEHPEYHRHKYYMAEFGSNEQFLSGEYIPVLKPKLRDGEWFAMISLERKSR